MCKTININYFITDHLGSTRVIVGSNGEIKEQKDYYPFGKEHENPNLTSSTNRWGFSGKEKQTVKDLGWFDFTARMYANSEIPMFTTQDPLSEKYYSVSPYAYCGNNPVKYVDPDGRKIKFAQGSSRQFIMNFVKASIHLVTHNSAEKLFKVMASSNTYVIKEGSLKSNFSIKTKTITWDPNLGYITSEGHILSPTTVLNHELDHTAQFDENPEKQRTDINTPDADYKNKEEKRVITGSEQTTAKNLGEIKDGEVTRRKHSGDMPYMTKGPTTTVGINEIEGSTVIATPVITEPVKIDELNN